MFTKVPAAAKMPQRFGRVAELADAKDLGSFGAILAGSTPVAPTNKIKVRWLLLTCRFLFLTTGAHLVFGLVPGGYCRWRLRG